MFQGYEALYSARSQSLYYEVWVDADHVMCCKIKELSSSSFNIIGISGELLAEVRILLGVEE